MSSAKQNSRIKNKRRFGDPWVSKNRVLNPNKSKRNCPIYRNPNFDTDETKLLIQLWGDPKIQRELITTHKKHLVIAQLASKMEEYGYYRSPEEITTRIKNMKCFYNRLKKEMEINVNLDPSWRHFADMEAIMTRPIFSVRPNEVPAPSLKYLMEQEEEKRKERKRKAEEEGISRKLLLKPGAVPSILAADFNENVGKRGRRLADRRRRSVVESHIKDVQYHPENESKVAEEEPLCIEQMSNLLDQPEMSNTVTISGTKKNVAQQDSQDISTPGIDISDSDDDIDDVLAVPITNGSERSDDECIIPDADIEFECDDITLAAIANGATEKCDKPIQETDNKSYNPDDELLIKMEIESEEFQNVDHNNEVLPNTKQSTDHKKHDTELLTPKIEPIDVEDHAQSNNDNKTPAKAATITAPNLMEILNQSKNSQTMPTSIAVANFSMSQGCYTNNITTASSSSSSSSPMVISSSATPSKISVVSPTILMPHTNQIPSTDTSHSTLPMRISGNLQAFLTSSGPRQTMTAANGMKFILVNTGDQRRPSTLGAPSVTMATTSLNPNTANGNIKQNLQSSQKIQNQPQPRTQKSIQSPSIKSNNGPITSAKKPTFHSLQAEKGEVLRKKELTGIKATLVRLLKSREDGNELQSQRLAIERERLQHERTVSEKYLAIFDQNQKFQQQLLQQQQQILQMQQQQQLLQAQHRPTTTQQLFATTTNAASTAMQNSGQLMMPPKLLITTMVPTSAANASCAVNTTLAPKVLTTANFKNLKNNIASTAVDKPLLIPKEEPDN